MYNKQYTVHNTLTGIYYRFDSGSEAMKTYIELVHESEGWIITHNINTDNYITRIDLFPAKKYICNQCHFNSTNSELVKVHFMFNHLESEGE